MPDSVLHPAPLSTATRRRANNAASSPAACPAVGIGARAVVSGPVGGEAGFMPDHFSAPRRDRRGGTSPLGTNKAGNGSDRSGLTLCYSSLLGDALLLRWRFVGM